MKEPNEDRDYKYLDIQALNESELTPIDDPPEEVLEGGLNDIIQLAQSGGMIEDALDRVLSRIIDARAKRNRGRFTLHVKDETD